MLSEKSYAAGECIPHGAYAYTAAVDVRMHFYGTPHADDEVGGFLSVLEVLQPQGRWPFVIHVMRTGQAARLVGFRTLDEAMGGKDIVWQGRAIAACRGYLGQTGEIWVYDFSTHK